MIERGAVPDDHVSGRGLKPEGAVYNGRPYSTLSPRILSHSYGILENAVCFEQKARGFRGRRSQSERSNAELASQFELQLGRNAD